MRHARASPNDWPNDDQVNSAAVSAIWKPLTIQIEAAGVMCISRPIVGSATFAIVPSSTAIVVAAASTIYARRRCGSGSPSASSGLETAFIIRVVSFATRRHLHGRDRARGKAGGARTLAQKPSRTPARRVIGTTSMRHIRETSQSAARSCATRAVALSSGRSSQRIRPCSSKIRPGRGWRSALAARARRRR